LDSVGPYLRAKRLSRNIELEEVSEATGISQEVLRTLEKEEKEYFPAEVYVMGFYKKYATYLDLDPEEILAAYQKHSHRPRKTWRRVNFNTLVKLKGQEANLFVEIARKLFKPGAIILLGILLYWLYRNT